MINKPRYLTVEGLRGIAALAVIFHHVSRSLAAENPFMGIDVGSAGVDLFFAISGFVMFVAARDEKPFAFLIRRFFRVVPLYFVATILTYVLYERHFLVKLDFPHLRDLSLSLVFAPYTPTPGLTFPYLILGWTLDYEILFYIIFFAGLIIGRPIATTLILIFLLVVCGLILPVRSTAIQFWTDPIILEFLMGVGIACLTQHVQNRWLSLATIVGVLGLAVLPSYLSSRTLFYGLPCAFLLLGCVQAERVGLYRRSKVFAKVGGASYSIYLFQFFGIGSAHRLVAAALPTNVFAFWMYLIMSMAIAIAIGLLSNLWLERPMQMLARRLTRNPAQAARD